MRWQSERRSSNISDRRGAPKALIGGGGLLLVGVVVALLGGDPTAFFVEGINRTIQTRTQASAIPKEEQDKLVDFVSVVLGGTEDSWHQRFKAAGMEYREPQLVVYSGAVNTQCGQGFAALGPFYCPNDFTVYLDLEFFGKLNREFGAPGDFAQAYVVAHEVGHHVQNLLNILEKADLIKKGSAPKQANAVSVQVELMADCFAGVWAYDTENKNLLDTEDIYEALQAASSIGDDAIQKKTQGHVVPDSFTHGSSGQRYQAFMKGFETGSMDACVASE